MSLFDVRPDWSGYNVINVGTQQASLTDLGNIFTCHWSLSRSLRNKLLRIKLISYKVTTIFLRYVPQKFKDMGF